MFHLGDIRPDEFYRQQAMRWTQAVRDQMVHQDAAKGVAQEQSGYQTLSGAMPPVA